MMKLAVISFTVNGTRLNRKLCATLSEKLKTNAADRDEILIFCYVKSKQPPVLEEAGKQPECMVWQRPLNDWAREMFAQTPRGGRCSFHAWHDTGCAD